MKVKLTPELAYIIGFWRKRRTFEGLGVRGDETSLQIFSQEVLEKGLTASNKLLNDEKKVYFFHSAYRKFFQEVEKEQLERFKYMNEYAANYLAGIFDSTGEIDDFGKVCINKANREDEMLLLRLGFSSRRREDRLVVSNPKAFLLFIKNYVKRFKDDKVFDYVKAK